MSRKVLGMIALVVVVGLISAACAGEKGEPGATGVPGLQGDQGIQGAQGIQGELGLTGDPGISGEGIIGSHLSPDLYAITMEPVGHWHVGSTKTLLFTVTDTVTGEPASVKDLVIEITRSGSTRVSSRSVDAGQVTYEGDGIYSLEYTASNFAPHAFSARFADGGQVFSSQPWVAEIAKGGEEDIGSPDWVYQVRYYWDPGHAHASDEDNVTLSFEIMRGVQEGTDINWDRPWSNTFNHIVDAEHPEVLIVSEDGTVSEEVHPVYKGKGIYDAERIFSVDEVGGPDGKDYLVTFVFTDPYNGNEVSNAEPYPLHLVSPH